MKILSTMLVTVTLLVIGFLLLSSSVNNAGSNASKPSVRKMQSGEYHSQFKRRDFIMERRDNERKKTNTKKVSGKSMLGAIMTITWHTIGRAVTEAAMTVFDSTEMNVSTISFIKTDHTDNVIIVTGLCLSTPA